MRQKRDFFWVLLLVFAFVVMSGGCGGGGGDDGDNGDKTFSNLPSLPEAPETSGNWADAADTTWYVEGQESFTISTAEQLAGLGELYLNGKTITLANDIDLAGKEWTPVAFSGDGATGIFDGGGHTISNVTVTGDMRNAGLFSSINGATIKNLNVTDVYIDISSNSDTNVCFAGGVVGDNSGMVENCASSGVVSSYIHGQPASGGIVGYNTGEIANCRSYADVFSSTPESSNPMLLDAFPYAGGIVGRNTGVVNGCVSEGDVASYPYHGAAGGVAGLNEGSVTDSGSDGSVASFARGPDAGGVVGRNYGGVWDCASRGSVTAYNSNNTFFAAAGGIVARSYGSVGNSFKSSGRVSITNTKSAYAFSGGVIGVLSISDSTPSPEITGNTYSKAATGLGWGIGYDARKSNAPSDDGAAPID